MEVLLFQTHSAPLPCRISGAIFEIQISSPFRARSNDAAGLLLGLDQDLQKLLRHKRSASSTAKSGQRSRRFGPKDENFSLKSQH